MTGRGSWRVTFLGLLLACGAPTRDGAEEQARVTIPPGASLRTVADTLLVRGLIRSPAGFRFLARLRRLDRQLKAGVYDLPRGASPWELLSILETGRVATARLTIPEGLALIEMARLVEQQLGIPADSVVARARAPELLARYGVSSGSLEGYLLPETYLLPLPVTAGGLVDAMAAEFTRRWNPAWDRRLDSLGMSRHQLLALASIVEGEARHDDERATIAGVYTNRLRRGMLLQADPTVQYALLQATGARKPRLLYRDLAINSPYNTYRSRGLPPGPVNSPGTASIQASLYPAEVPWLYFVAGPDGHHRFSRTLTEHNRIIGELRRAERAAQAAPGR